jgi:hypothetical protein
MQWFHNGAPIPGANGARHDIASVQPNDAGSYWLEYVAGEQVSRSPFADLTVNVPRRGNIVRELVLENKFADLFYAVQDNKPLPLFQPQSEDSSFLPSSLSVAKGITGAQIFNTYGARKEMGEPDHCGLPGGASQWFAYEAPADGVLTITTEGSDFDTILAVYTSTGSRFEDLTEIACDNNGGFDSQDSTVTFPALAGSVYYVAIDGVGGETGIVNLGYDLAIEMELNDVMLTDLGLQFEVKTIPGIQFIIERTQDFGTWEVLLKADSGNGSYLFRDENALGQERQFYRVYVAE